MGGQMSASKFVKCVTVGDVGADKDLKWIPELRHHAPGVPIILVGTKLDLRKDEQFLDRSGAEHITHAQGEELKRIIGARYYIECSSITQQNLKAVFDAAVKVVR